MMRDSAGFMGKEGCVEGWPGRPDKNGYPITMVGGKYRSVARLMYELFVGPVPDGMVVRHKCDNPAAHADVALLDAIRDMDAEYMIENGV